MNFDPSATGRRVVVFVWRSIDKAEAGRWVTDKMSWFVIRSLCLKTHHIDTKKIKKIHTGPDGSTSFSIQLRGS